MLRVSLEIARTDGEKRLGLMHRRRLAPNHGMLFLFDEAAHRCLWMKNTHIPLDMIFLDDKHTIVDIVESAQPHSLTPRCSRRPAQYVIEVAGGFARKHGIRPGTRVEFRS